MLLFCVGTKDAVVEAWSILRVAMCFWSKSERRGALGIFFLNSAGEVEELGGEWMDLTGQQLVVQLLSTVGICFLQSRDPL